MMMTPFEAALTDPQRTSAPSDPHSTEPRFESGWLLSALATVTLSVSGLMAVQGQVGLKEPSISDLNPNRPHVEIIFETEPPHLALYSNPELRGTPVVVLNDKGLIVRGRVACAWPGGQFDRERWSSMVLGYVDAGTTVYRGCPDAMPVKSVWSVDDGEKAARLFVEVTSRRGSLVQVKQGPTSFYFDLNSLRGDPRSTLNGYGLRLKGFTGWAWQESSNDSQRHAAAASASLQRDPSFQTFLRGVRACLSSSAVPGCFAQFVQPEIYYPALWHPTGPPTATPAEFVEFLWSESSDEGSRRWDGLAACFSHGELTDAAPDRARFETSVDYCDLVKVRGRWFLQTFTGRP